LTADSNAAPKPTSSGTMEARQLADDLRNKTEVQPPINQPLRLSGSDVWLRRTAVLLFITLSAVVGVLLVLLPWSLQWTANRLLWSYPDVRTAMGNGFVRGVCSGLGFLNLWMGFREAVNYHEGHGTAK
jgi:hypothetical protein